MNGLKSLGIHEAAILQTSRTANKPTYMVGLLSVNKVYNIFNEDMLRERFSMMSHSRYELYGRHLE